jgi:hypothetical protein
VRILPTSIPDRRTLRVRTPSVPGQGDTCPAPEYTQQVARPTFRGYVATTSRAIASVRAEGAMSKLVKLPFSEMPGAAYANNAYHVDVV